MAQRKISPDTSKTPQRSAISSGSGLDWKSRSRNRPIRHPRLTEVRRIGVQTSGGCNAAFDRLLFHRRRGGGWMEKGGFLFSHRLPARDGRARAASASSVGSRFSIIAFREKTRETAFRKTLNCIQSLHAFRFFLMFQVKCGTI